MNDMAYVITANGLLDSYGVAIYLLGVFLDKTVAEEQVKKYEGAYITEIPINQFFPLHDDNDGFIKTNDYPLGEYIE